MYRGESFHFSFEGTKALEVIQLERVKMCTHIKVESLEWVDTNKVCNLSNGIRFYFSLHQFHQSNIFFWVPWKFDTFQVDQKFDCFSISLSKDPFLALLNSGNFEYKIFVLLKDLKVARIFVSKNMYQKIDDFLMASETLWSLNRIKCIWWFLYINRMRLSITK